MTCPDCDGPVDLKSPDYGRGAEFYCHRCRHQFGSSTPEAKAASDASCAKSARGALRFADEYADAVARGAIR